jgi:hypothetical protein
MRSGESLPERASTRASASEGADTNGTCTSSINLRLSLQCAQIRSTVICTNHESVWRSTLAPVSLRCCLRGFARQVGQLPAGNPSCKDNAARTAAIRPADRTNGMLHRMVSNRTITASTTARKAEVRARVVQVFTLRIVPSGLNTPRSCSYTAKGETLLSAGLRWRARPESYDRRSVPH